METGEVFALCMLLFSGVVTVPFFLHYRGERRKRELEHIERMRAIDVGRPYPGDHKFGLWNIPHWAVPHAIAVLVGAVVPVGVFLFAFLASLSLGFHNDIWVAAAIVGLGSVICGTVLECTAFATAHSSGEPEQAAGAYLNSKPHIDEDAYDVVSTRG